MAVAEETPPRGRSLALLLSYGSPATGEDMLALIRHLGRPATIIGHSNAAAAAIWAGAQEPDLVSGLVLVGPFILGDGKLSPLMSLALRIVTRSPMLWSRLAYPSFYKVRPVDFADYIRTLQVSLRQPGRMAAVMGVATEQELCRARIAELRCPVQIVMGTKDPDFPDAVAAARDGEALVGQHTQVSVALIDGAGHYPHAELPEATASAVLPFLTEVVLA